MLSIPDAWNVPENIHAGNLNMMEGSRTMKANISPTDNQSERATAYAMNIMNINLDRYRSIYVIAACEMFGLGSKRANAFIDLVLKRIQDFEDYDDPEIMDRKIKENLETYGVDPDRLFTSEYKTIKQIAAEEKAKKKAKISLAEANIMKRNLENMRGLMMARGRGNV